jgi:hypothetical protein
MLGFCKVATDRVWTGLMGNPLTIIGIPLPSDTPLFLALVALHIAAGLTCVVAGVVAMLSAWTPSVGGNDLLLGARDRVRHHVRAVDFALGGGLPSVRLGLLVFHRRDDWPDGAKGALALLGANSYDRDGRVLHTPDNRLLCGQRTEPAVVA